MSDVSRPDGDHGGLLAPDAPAGLTATPDTEAEPGDYWDRPKGDWGATDSAPLREEEAWWEDRAEANACYVLGSRALRRGELQQAAHWLGRAADHEHPGALFRLAVVACRVLGLVGTHRAVFLVSEAARCGHGDARALMRRRLSLPDGRERPGAQDPEFYDEVARALEPRPAAAAPAAPAAPAAAVQASAAAAQPWAPQALRAPSVTDTFQQQPSQSCSTKRWESVQRVLEVLDLVGGAGRSVSADYLRRKTSLPHQVIERLLIWLCGRGLLTTVTDGGYVPGPTLHILAQDATTASAHGPLQPNTPTAGQAISKVLAGLRDAAGAAVYVGTYSEGEIRVDQFADSPTTPAVNEWVDFRASGHATALGKSLLQQLDFDQRMDHLSRRRPVRLTSRTITNHSDLFRTLDGNGPHAAQFDLLEYSEAEVCVAIPLGVGGEAGCVALSLPVSQRHRLIEAARTLSSRSAILLISLLLTANPPRLEPGRQNAPHQPSPGVGSGNPVSADAVRPGELPHQEAADPAAVDARTAGHHLTQEEGVAYQDSADIWREFEALFGHHDEPEPILPDTPEALNRQHVYRPAMR
ncbi:IclR family transcriptional regulator domain-containing protein [Streptomyces sp. NRRL S-378]|uniref:IclR family transcriptional regulator domain-containing protein n=1 Tax=Streptomyces sp. NRRL S-378 TaxID=1463904 RepID=UPI000AF2D576|nr:IclR family transcriptional regulator C-terminal domain-containing protein [Streptomyces sp. NRRL S-378]